MKGWLFTSAPRSLDDLDTLSRAMNQLSKQLGEERSKEIEKHPEEFFNANKFWYYQVKAYLKAIPFTLIALPLGVFAVGGHHGSHHIVKNRKPLIAAAGLMTYYLSYKFFEKRIGFKKEDWIAHNYAKYLIITRNARVKC